MLVNYWNANFYLKSEDGNWLKMYFQKSLTKIDIVGSSIVSFICIKKYTVVKCKMNMDA